MKNINKDKLIEMIRSSDSEIKKLGISLLLDNFDLPEKLYYDKDSNGYYTYSWKFSSTSVNFLNKEAYLQYLNIFCGKINESILYAIFKYNEDNRKE